MSGCCCYSLPYCILTASVRFLLFQLLTAPSYFSPLTHISHYSGGFSKASFVSADSAEDVDINDPDFWRKAVGLSEIPLGADDEAAMFEDGGGRKRRQIKVYGGEEFDDENFPENPHETKKERKERLGKEKKEKDIADKKEKEREAKEKKEKEVSEKKEKGRQLKEKKEKEKEERMKLGK